MGVDDRLRHTDEELAAGRAGIEAVRTQLGNLRSAAQPGRRSPQPERETIELPQLEAEMTWGAERERLEKRVNELEEEVRHLRRALAAILREAAHAVAGEAIDSAQAPPRTSATP